MEKLTIAYIGFGKSTTRYHLPYVLNRPTIEVKSIYARSEKPEEAEFSEYGIEFVRSVDAILDDPAIQLVVICTPPNSHFDYGMQVLNSGKHVLVEKPFSWTKQEAKEIFSLANEKGLIAMPYQNRRFDSDYLALLQAMADERMGQVVELESHFDRFRPQYNLPLADYKSGAFYGLGVHLIDQIVALFGAPDRVSYDIRSIRNPENKQDDYFDIQLFYPTFKAIVKCNHLVVSGAPRWQLLAQSGSFKKLEIDRQELDLKDGLWPKDEGFGLDRPEDYGTLYFKDAEDGPLTTEILPTPQGDYGRVYDNLYDVIYKGTDKLVSDEDALTVIEILENGMKYIP